MPAAPEHRSAARSPRARAATPPTGHRVAGSQRHGDPDLHSETDGLKKRRRPRHHLPGGGAPSSFSLFASPRRFPSAAPATSCSRPRRVAAARPIPVRERAPIVARTEHLNRGETLIGLLKRAGISSDAALDVVRAATASARQHALPARRHAGRGQVRQRGRRRRASWSSTSASIACCACVRSDSGWTGSEERLAWTTDTVVVGGTIHANLYQAMDEAAAALFPGHAKDELAWALADIFEYRVDMSRDLQEGDRFRALVERAVAPDRRDARGQGARRVVHALGQRDRRRSASRAAVGGRVLRRERQVAARAVPPRAARVPPHLEHLRHALPPDPRPLEGAQGHRLRRVVRHAGARDRRCALSGRAGPVATATCSNCAIATATLRAMDTCAGSPRGSARERASRSARRSRYVGTTGLSTGPHLHFEVLVGGVQRDSRAALRSTTGEPARRERARGVRPRCASRCSPRSTARPAWSRVAQR